MIKRDNGFTLIEVVIAMTIFSIVLVAGYQLLFSGFKSWIHGEEQIDVVQNMRVGMDFMTREIRSAQSIVTGKKDFIVIKVPKADFSTINVRYKYDNNQELERQEGTFSPQPIASKISGLSFAYSGDPINIVEVTLKGKRKDGYEVTMKSKVTVRSLR